MSYRVTIPDDTYFREQVNCQSACPVGTDARGYVRAIAEGDHEKAYLIARGPNPLASICGRVCGAPCEAACRRTSLDRAVSIRALKRFVTERFGTESGRFSPIEILQRVVFSERAAHSCEGEEELRSLRRRLGELDPARRPAADAPTVAIIGSGPAGLACAHDLALLGLRSVVFEMEPEPAGMLIYGIPEYRLPRDLIRAEIEVIRALGVEFRCDTRVGTDIAFDAILRDFAAVVVAVGAKSSRKIPLPGLEGPGVLGGVEFLRDVALGATPPELGKRIVVIGGGNVAYDVARTAVRQVGLDVSRTALRQKDVAAVTLASLESLDEMPADDVEILEGDEEGVRRLNSLGPLSIERDAQGRVTGVRFKRCLRVFDDEGRFAPLFDEADTTLVEGDTVILSVGQTFDVSFIDPARDGVELSERGFVVNDPETLATTRPGAFVAGDLAYGPKLLIHAVASGKKVAREVYRHLKGSDVTPATDTLHQVIKDYVREKDYEKIPRVALAAAPVAERLRSQAVQVEMSLDETRARREASRCFDCGVNPIFEGTKCVLCGGCVDVCPESCLKIVSLERLEPLPELAALRQQVVPEDEASAILKDEELCIRCGLCAERCPNDAITMERFCLGGLAPMNEESTTTVPEESQRFTEEVKRRDFLGLAALWSFVITGVVMVAGMLRLPMPSVFPETGSKFRLGPPDRFPPDSRTLVADRNVLVIHDASGFAVMDLVCTHLGCITRRETDGTFTCPCHGSRFGVEGEVTQGPAPSALRYLDVIRSPSGVLVVDRETAVESSFRLQV